MRTRRRYLWAREELAGLDPVTDYDRIARLVGEVRYGWPPIIAAFYTVTFARQVAVPSIAQILHRGGRSPSITGVRKRNDDTLVIFGELFANGAASARGGETIERLQEIHGLFPITQDDYRYTLCTIIDEPARSAAVIGYDSLSWTEKQGWFRFWQHVGERMGITDIPASWDEALAHSREYERAHWSSTKAGRAVADAVIGDYADRFLPARLRFVGVRAVHVLLGPELRRVHGYPEPHPLFSRAVLGALRTYLRARRVLPDPAERSVTAAFGQECGGACPHLADVGYRRPAADAGEPSAGERSSAAAPAQ